METQHTLYDFNSMMAKVQAVGTSQEKEGTVPGWGLRGLRGTSDILLLDLGGGDVSEFSL